MKKCFFIAAIALIGLSSCSRTYFFKPSETTSQNQVVTFQNGIECITHKQDGITVSAHMLKSSGSDVNLMLSIYNDSDSTLTFFPDQVSAKGYNQKGVGKSLTVMTPRDVVKRQNKRTAIAVGSVIALTAAIIIAEETSDNRNNNNNFNNNRYAYDPFWYWIPPPTTLLMIPPQSAGIVQSRDGLMRTHTLLPGEELRGKIILKRPGAFTESMEVYVPVDGRAEVFSFKGTERVF
jgi:hypothetical protein